MLQCEVADWTGLVHQQVRQQSTTACANIKRMIMARNCVCFATWRVMSGGGCVLDVVTRAADRVSVLVKKKRLGSWTHAALVEEASRHGNS